MMEPKVIDNVKVSTGHKVYWCPKREMQMIDVICQQKYFSQSSSKCKACLKIGKGRHFTEPWASIGKKDEQVNIVDSNYPGRIYSTLCCPLVKRRPRI
jgi:hypothetical protein